MKCLAVNTATKTLSIALMEDDRVLHYFESPEMRDQGNLLLGHIQEGLKKTNLSFADLDLLAVVTGPGSFTGIRIGLAAMRGIAIAADKPIIGITSFEMFAADNSNITLVAVESWREELYFALLDAKGPPLIDGVNETPEIFAGRCRDLLPKGTKLHLAGDAKLTMVSFFEGATLTEKDGNAADVARLAIRKFKKGGEFARPVPYYLREADVSISAKLVKTLGQ